MGKTSEPRTVEVTADLTVDVAQDRWIEWMRLDAIVRADANPRDHDIPALRKAITRFGFGDMPELDERTGKLVAGHGRLTALEEMRGEGQSAPAWVRADDDGMWLVPVSRGWSSRSDAEAAAYLVGNNRHTELAHWDQRGLADMLVAIQEVDPELAEAAGYDGDDISDILKRLEPDDLDDLDAGDPDPSDMWPTVSIRKVPPHVAASWRSYVDTYGGKEVEAFAALLEVDPEPSQGWTP